MKQTIPDNFVDETIKLGKLLMDFSKVYRATYTDKESTRESDTDHTTMLAIMACAIASSLELGLDIGKIAQYAIIHDLVEVYAGDVNTINFHTTDMKAKEVAEKAALARIKVEFGETFPWIHETIEKYELLSDGESRYIKTLDKIMPAITHIHTDGIAVDDGFDNPEAFHNSVKARSQHMRETYASDFDVIMQLRDKILEPTIKRKYEKHGKKQP